jgi:hypothetical protein
MRVLDGLAGKMDCHVVNFRNEEGCALFVDG